MEEVVVNVALSWEQGDILEPVADLLRRLECHITPLKSI